MAAAVRAAIKAFPEMLGDILRPTQPKPLS
jgi:hypothetical protein